MNSKFSYSLLFFLLLLAHVAAGVYFNGYSPWWILWCILAYITLLVLASIKIQWNFYFKSLNLLPILKITFEKGQLQLVQNQKQIALTFDDGPAEQTEAVLDILKKENIKATFFLIGKNIQGRETLVQRMFDEGHSIGNHSFNHGFNFDWQSASRMTDELVQTNEAIENITKQEVKLFRPPYGVTNPNLAKAVTNTGLKSIGWSLRSMDTIAKSESELLEKILKQVKARDIILLHDRCAVTAAILPDLIKELKKRNYSFASL
ncbi:polysaccharide deacetylase family protein [Taibaiella lutea]|uniref:polysaccharide deacetylase family protein n=1 Tax=Taibaiella lutea TaxID=2608001 RepID=UPI00167FE292|nr:polysaccharide deacetylase family protein [Taibaiella lutea]